MLLAVENRFRAVEKLVLAAQVKGLDPEIAAHYCKLGCVMICGAVERSVEILVAERVAGKTLPRVSNFLRSYFKRGTNYDCEEIARLLYRFDRQWEDRFQNFVSESDEIRTGVASCYAVRNSIAHGGAQSLGPKILKQYFNNSFTLIVELELALRPNRSYPVFPPRAG